MVGSEQVSEHFRRAEDSFLLEGLDARNSPEYQEMKARIIAGDLDVDDAIRQTVERFKALAEAATPELASVR